MRTGIEGSVCADGKSGVGSDEAWDTGSRAASCSDGRLAKLAIWLA